MGFYDELMAFAVLLTVTIWLWGPLLFLTLMGLRNLSDKIIDKFIKKNSYHITDAASESILRLNLSDDEREEFFRAINGGADTKEILKSLRD